MLTTSNTRISCTSCEIVEISEKKKSGLVCFLHIRLVYLATKNLCSSTQTDDFGFFVNLFLTARTRLWSDGTMRYETNIRLVLTRYNEAGSLQYRRLITLSSKGGRIGRLGWARRLPGAWRLGTKRDSALHACGLPRPLQCEREGVCIVSKAILIFATMSSILGHHEILPYAFHPMLQRGG